MMGIVFWSFVALLVIACVGHGIWVLVAWVFRGLMGLAGAGTERPIPAEMCPRCGAVWGRHRGDRSCVLCGWPGEGAGRLSHASTRRILMYLEKRVEWYHQLGLITNEVRDRLVKAFQDDPRTAAPGSAPVREIKFLDAPELIREQAVETARPVILTPVGDVADRTRPDRKPFENKAADRAGTAPAPPIPALAPRAVPAGTGQRSQRMLTLLAAFLEEKNIRWGEIVGGLLIVGCSLALVVSFWSSIAERPFLKFGLFTGVTALLFALGLHAERRWNLPTTALGLLLIATLLIPLNFLAVASLGRGAVVETAGGVAAELVTVVLFAALLYRAGQSLVTRAPAALLAGVLVPSTVMLLIRRYVDPGGGLAALLALGAAPILAQGAAVAGLIVRVRREPEVDEPHALDLLRLLGLTTFAVSLALGLLLAQAGLLATALHRAAPLAPAAGASALATGLLLWRRTTAHDLVGYRTAGTAIAAAGVLVMLSGVVLGWPDPAGMLPVALLNGAVLATVALAFEVPAAHVLAGACLTLAYLIGWSVLAGTLGWKGVTAIEATNALLSSRSGSALLPIVLLYGGSAAAAQRLGRRLDAQAFAVVAALAGTFSLGLVTWYGFGRPGDPAGAAWVYAMDALAAMVGAAWFGRYPLVEGTAGEHEARTLGWAASGLLLGALVQALVFGAWVPGLALPWVVALLAHATLTSASAAILSNRPGGPSPTGILLRDLLAQSALATSIVAAGAVVGLAIAVAGVASSSLAAHLLWLALVWLALAWQYASPTLFAACQGALTVAVVFAVATVLEGRAWYARAPRPWLDPWTLQAHAIASGLLCLSWIGVRLFVRSRPPKSSATARQLLDPPWPAFDRWARGAVVVALVLLAISSAWPGVARELSPRDQGAGFPGSSAPVIAGPRVVPPADEFELAHVPHGHALGAGSWVLLGLELAVLLAGHWERFRCLDLIGAVLAGSMAVPLLAGRWEAVVGSASALRWWCAVFLLIGSGLIWGREWLARWVVRAGWRFEPEEVLGLWQHATATVLALALLPVLTVTFSVIGSEVAGYPIVGPEPGSWFARIGRAGSYAPPLVLVAAALVGSAIRERSTAFAFAAGLALNLAATAGYLLAGVPGGLTFDATLWTRLAQLNAIVASATALTWIDAVAAWRRRMGPEGSLPADGFLITLTVLGVVLNGLVLIAGTAAVFFWPLPGGMNAAIAGPWGWAAISLSAGAVATWAWRSRRPISPDGLALGFLGIADFLALGLAVRDTGDWRTYHGVLAGQALAGALLPLIAWQRSGMQLAAVAEARRAAVVRWASVALGVVVLFALRAYGSDPQSPWWTVGGLAGMVPLAATLAVWARRPSFLMLAGVLLNLAVTLWWCATPGWWRAPGGGLAGADLLNINVLALALPAPIWLGIDRYWLRPASSRRPVDRPSMVQVERVPFQRIAAWIASVLLLLVVVVGLADDAAQVGARPNVVLGWTALAAASLAMGVGLWDERSRSAVTGLYLLGLCASGWAVHQLHLPPQWLVWTGTIVLSAYSVATSFAWSRRDALRALADRLRVPRPEIDDPNAGLAWLSPANLALAAGVLFLAFGTILTDPDPIRRSLSAHAALAEVLATALLARGERRLRLQFVALGVGVVGVLAWGWSWIAPDAPNGVLDRLVVVLVALLGTSALYGLGLAKLFPKETEWTHAARRLVPGLLGLGALSFVLLLGTEAFERLEGQDVAISPPAVVAVVAVLLTAGGAALIAAIVPGRDPLGLSERGRTAYVYGCEVLLAGILLHLRLTEPWLFSGFFARYRPLIILGVAFLGVGVSEIFRRQGRLVLAEPLERTGALLPALPMLGAYWVEPRPGEDTLFLVLAGGLYTLLSLLRSSLGFGALAALAYNGAVWVVLGRREGFGLLEHPQLWVIPPAFCVLIGAYLNRDKLSEAQTTSIRYAASLAIYLSSTSDIILTGVAQAPWLPLVLGALSLLGIFAGIFLRVRGFLFLGLGFLGLSLFTIIWYAAVDLRQTWLWSASGIVVGIMILALFGLFEKKRQEVLRMVEQVKEWNP